MYWADTVVLHTDGHLLPLSHMVWVPHWIQEAQDAGQSRFETGFAGLDHDIWISYDLMWHLLLNMSRHSCCCWGCCTRMTTSQSIWIMDPQAYALWNESGQRWRFPQGMTTARHWLIPINLVHEHWFLIAVDLDQGRIHVEDSLRVDQPRERVQVLAWLSSQDSCFSCQWEHTFSRRKRQSSYTDCCIFIVLDAMCIAGDLDANAIQHNIPLLCDWLTHHDLLWSKGTLVLQSRTQLPVLDQTTPFPCRDLGHSATSTDAPGPSLALLG
eukprot:532442-Rhodomonas_salina.2